MINKYQKFKILVIFLLVFLSSLIVIERTKAYLTDTEKILGNSIQIGIWGITPSPSIEITPTPTSEITLTPTPTETQEQPGEPTETPTPSPSPSPTPTNTSTPTPTVTPTPGNLANHVVISEIQTAGVSAEDEFIELYNPTDSAVDISSWSIQFRGGSAGTYNRRNFIGGNSIPARGFFLIIHTGSTNPIIPDLSQGSFSLSANGTIFLVNNQTTLTEETDSGPTIIDKVAYGTGASLRPEGNAYTPAPDNNQSIERKAYSTSDSASMTSGLDITKGNAYDSNNNSFDFIPRITPEPQNSASPTEIP